MIEPLTLMSDFVKNELPATLAKEHQCRRLLWRLDELASWVDAEALAQARTSTHWPVIYLDLTMIEAAIGHTCTAPPRRFRALMDAVYNTDGPPGLKYGSLVLDNPEHEMRSFMAGDVGKTELLFYVAHRKIEETLTKAIQSLECLLLQLEGNGDGTGALAPEEFEKLLNSIVSAFPGAGLARMDLQHFALFRRYLMPNPHRATAKGPSGAFSAQMPILELLYRNGAPVAGFRPYLQENWGYFPRQHRARLTSALREAEKGRTLLSLKDRSSACHEAVEYDRILGMFFYRFRSAHKRASEKQVLDNPHINTDIGTQGVENIREFLGERIGPNPLAGT